MEELKIDLITATNNYSFQVQDKNVRVIVTVDQKEGFTLYVEMEIIINNLRICRFFLNEIPGMVVIQAHIAVVFYWHYQMADVIKTGIP